MAQLTEKQRKFIVEHPYVGTVTTIRPDGTPHSTVVWVDAEDGVVTFNTAVGRAKERYLRQNPNAAITSHVMIRRSSHRSRSARPVAMTVPMMAKIVRHGTGERGSGPRLGRGRGGSGI